MRRKVMALTTAVLMVGSLVGCNSNSGGDTAAPTEKVYKIATDTTFAPFEFENDNGDMVGIDLDLLKAIAEDQGFQYELQVVGFTAATTALEAGECDGMIAGMSITDERSEKYDFSDPYYDSGVGMAVLASSDIKTYDDLNGQEVAAKIGTEGCTFAESIADQYGFTIVQYEDSTSMYQAVLGGSAVACFEDYPVLGYEISRGVEFALPLPMEKGNSYGFAVLKDNNSELLEMFNAGLKNMKDSGKYDEIINTYVSK